MNNLKKQIGIVALALMTSIGSVANAQTEVQNGSGSGNGDGRRDALEYQQELVEAGLDLKSVEEEFARLRKKILDLAAVNIPAYDPSDDAFWDTLTPKGQEIVKGFDQALADKIKAGIIILDGIEKMIQSEAATIAAFSNESQNYTERGYQKNFKSTVFNMKRGLGILVRHEYYKVISFALGGIMYVNYNNMTGPTVEVMQKCDTAVCVNIVSNRAVEFAGLLNQISKIKVNVFNGSVALGKVYNGQSGNNIKLLLRDFTQILNQNTFSIISAKNIADIKKNNGN